MIGAASIARTLTASTARADDAPAATSSADQENQPRTVWKIPLHQCFCIDIG